MLVVLLGCSDGPRPPAHDRAADPGPAEADRALVFTEERPHNLLMISIDTTRRDHLAPYAADGGYLPFLSGKMAEGVRLDAHQQCSNWTFASTSCTLQGRYADEQGWLPAMGPIEDAWLPDGQRSFAVRLGERGYATVLVSGNGWLSPAVNNAQGYDVAPAPTSGEATGLALEARDALEARLGGDPDEPWFLHLHLMEPHPPYTPPAAFLDEEAALEPLPDGVDLDTQTGQYDAGWALWPTLTPEEQALLEAHLRARYHGELRWLDTQLVTVWQLLEDAGLLDDTLVVGWTDHGEQFWEHGDQAHGFWLGAEENDGVAWFWARTLQPRAWTGPTHAVDLLPTALDALGLLDDPGDPTLSGAVIGGELPVDRDRFGMSIARGGVLQSVTSGDGWKLVFDWRGRLALYDREADPAEAVDLYARDRAELGPLWDALLPRIHAFEALGAGTPVWPEGLPQ